MWQNRKTGYLSPVKFIGIVYLTFFAMVLSGSQAFSAESAHLLLLGDSWAEFMCLDHSLQNALKKIDHSEVSVDCRDTSHAGSKASEWASGWGQKKIGEALTNNPAINIVVISAGGNDFLETFKITMSIEQEQVAYENILTDLHKLIQFIQSKKPGVKILLSGYDYPNFQRLSKNPLIKFYQNIYVHMGEPTTEKLNIAAADFNNIYIQLTNEFKGVMFSNHMGLMQYHFGIPEQKILPETVPFPGQYPNYLPSAGGLNQYSSPEVAMFHIFKEMDPYHLNKQDFKSLPIKWQFTI